MNARSPIAVIAALSLVALSPAAPAATAESLPPTGGGGFTPPAHADALGPEARRQVQARIRHNRAALVAAGVLPSGAAGAAEPVRLTLPVEAVPGRTGPGFHGVSNFLDQDGAFPGAIEDYTCGERTYDTESGYNHSGTDYFLWPFPWYRMDAEAVAVVAAAPGVIVFKQDGRFDRSCGSSSEGWNAVYVEHEDGTVAWYGHLKQGSVTPEPVGAAIARGEVLGLVGSSGNSTGPHLHFELHDPQGELIDPYDGSCNDTSMESWWLEQPDYYESAINEIATHSAPPEIPGCPEPERPNYRDLFAPGETVTFAAYYRDQLAGQVSTYTVRRPDGSVLATWTHEIADPHYSASYFFWDHALPPDAPLGEWRFEVDYEGTLYEHTFRVADMVFADGFETGDASGWSETSGD